MEWSERAMSIKLMWTNYPNMPTGANATPELYRKLVDFARRKDIVIVNDNPYSFILNEHPIMTASPFPPSAGSGIPHRTVSNVPDVSQL